jgi:hypothetical protein
VISFELPLTTPSLANARMHWARKAKLVKSQRWTAGIITRSKLEQVRESPPFVVMLVRVAPRELDDDNLRGALKGVRDGIADAFGINDRDPMVKWDYGQEKRTKAPAGVRITIMSQARLSTSWGEA